METYNAVVEVGATQVVHVDHLMTKLAAYHPAVGISPRGWLEARISVPAETLVQACTTAVAVVEAAALTVAIACEVMTEAEFEVREGFGPVLPEA
jgi:hypothetical protein